MIADEFLYLLAQTELSFEFGTWLWRVGQAAVVWSSGMYRLLGLHPSVPAEQALYLEALHVDDRRRELSLPPDADLSGMPRKIRLRQPGGDFRVVHLHMRYLTDRDGSSVQVGAIFDPARSARGEIALRHFLGKVGASTGGAGEVVHPHGQVLDPNVPLDPALIRAARALLDWSGEDLATASGLSFSTIRRAEDSNNRRVTSLSLLRETFERHGVQFVEMGQSVGVVWASPASGAKG